MEKIRILDLGKIEPRRTQVVYHAVGYSMKEETPNTIILVSPSSPYASVGYHQEVEKELDLEYCRSIDLPVYRREVGGGAVYLDDGQIFTQWIFQPGILPSSIEERFKIYAQPLVETYKSFGINANLRPVNDIHVSGKKIGGTGAAEMGIYEIVVGSLMLDFNKKVMSQILRVSSEKMRDKIYQSLEEYMTTMTEQLSKVPTREEIKKTYLEKCGEALNMDFYYGEWTDEEEEMAQKLDRRFESDEWLYHKTRRMESGIKISEDVRIYESALKAPGGLIRSMIRMKNGVIDDATISGDFTILPADTVPKIETEIKGKKPDSSEIISSIKKVYEETGAESPGVGPEHIRDAIMQPFVEGSK